MLKLLQGGHLKLLLMSQDSVKIWRVKFGESPAILRIQQSFLSAEHSHYVILFNTIYLCHYTTKIIRLAIYNKCSTWFLDVSVCV